LHRISKLILEESRVQDHLFLGLWSSFSPYTAFSLVASKPKFGENITVFFKDSLCLKFSSKLGGCEMSSPSFDLNFVL
jgi:hypothetical protein